MAFTFNPKLIYGISRDGYVILGDSNYNYANDNNITDLMIKYKKVQIDDAFDVPIDFLPNGITHLNIGESFNQSIDNLPITLKSLIISKFRNVGYVKFNQPLDNLPYGLEYLYIDFTYVFDQSLRNLPATLKHFELRNKNYTKNIDVNSFPDSIETIKIKRLNYDIINRLPANLKTFNMNSDSANYGNDEEFDPESPEAKFINRFSGRNIDFDINN
jgi:hypothetical protein